MGRVDKNMRRRDCDDNFLIIFKAARNVFVSWFTANVLRDAERERDRQSGKE